MTGYNKFTKKQLVEMLCKVEKELDGLVEEADSRATKEAQEAEQRHKEEYGTTRYESKYPYMVGDMEWTIKHVVNDILKGGSLYD